MVPLSLYGLIGMLYGEYASVVHFFGDGIDFGSFVMFMTVGQFFAAWYGLLWPMYAF